MNDNFEGEKTLRFLAGRRYAAVLGVGAAILILACTARPVSGAGFATAGIGLKARSMGGAFRGLADDWSAISYNPAGLAFMERNEANASLGTYSPQLGYDPSVSTAGLDLGYLAADTAGKLYPRDDLWPIPSLALTSKPRGKWGLAYGIGLMWPYDVNYGWDLFRAPVGYGTDYKYNHSNFHTDMDVMDVHPAIAKKFGDKFSAGVGLSILRGSVVYRRILPLANALGPGLDDYPINVFYTDYRMKGNGVGLGANFGFMWHATDKVSVGLSGQTPTTITMKGIAEINMAWPTNPARAQLSENLYHAVRSFFVGVNDEVNSQPSYFRKHYQYDLNLPGQIGAGVGIKASDRLTLALDAAVTFWSAVKSWDVRFADSGLSGPPTTYQQNDSTRVTIGYLTSLSVPFGWKDQVRISAGGEYMAKPNMAIRAGAYYDGGAAVDSTFTPNFPDVGNRIGLTAGLAYTIQGNWELSAAQEIAFASERKVPNTGAQDGLQVFPGTYSLTRYETLLSISYRF